MIIYYFLIGAFVRRWFGGALENIPVLKNRALQTGVMVGVFLGIYCTDWQNWFWPLVISLWLQFEFWSRGHGCCFDLGNGGYPGEETIKRYNERWYHKPCDWLAKKRFFSFYSVRYDFMYMTLRYTCPMIPLMFLDWRYFLVGNAAAPIYLFCWDLYNSDLWPSKLPAWANSPTKWAEMIYGGVVYASCYALGGLN